MRSDGLFSPYLSALDSQVSLSQELNLSGGPLPEDPDPEGLCTARASARDGLEPEEALALAIVLQAAEDWRDAVRNLRRSPDDRDAAKMLRETERFFRSPRFHLLMDLDGGALLARLKESEGLSASCPAEPESDAARRLEDLRLSLLNVRFA